MTLSDECFILFRWKTVHHGIAFETIASQNKLKRDSLRGKGERQHVLKVASVSWLANTSSADTMPSTKLSDGDRLFSLGSVNVELTTTGACRST